MSKSRRSSTAPMAYAAAAANPALANVSIAADAASVAHRKRSDAHHSAAPPNFTLSTLRQPASLLTLFIVCAVALTVLSTQAHFILCPRLPPPSSTTTFSSHSSSTHLSSSPPITAQHVNGSDADADLAADDSLSDEDRNARLIHRLERWKDKHFAASRLKIYVYNLPSRFNIDLVRSSHMSPSHIRDPYCDENFYSSEVHVHQFLLNSPVRVFNASAANLFYVPIYLTCDLINTQPNNLKRTGRNFKLAMDYVSNNFPYWNMSHGRDHVFLFSQGFSARLAGDWTAIKNAIFMVHNGEMTALEYNTHKDLTIPPELKAYFQPVWLTLNSHSSSSSSTSNSPNDHPANSHPLTSAPSANSSSSNSSVSMPATARVSAQADDVVFSRRRKYLAQFGGQVVNSGISDHRGSNYSGGVRQFIRTFLTDDPDYRITGIRSSTYLQDMMSSKFCLAPEGWHPWSPRPYYALHMGCVPVILSQVQEMAFEELVNWDQFAVFIRPSDVEDMDAILRAISDEDMYRRRRAMQQMWRVFWYDGEHGLAYQAILEALYKRKLVHRPRRVYGASNFVEQFKEDERRERERAMIREQTEQQRQEILQLEEQQQQSQRRQ